MVDYVSHYSGAGGQILARKVVDLMKSHNVPTSPPNYEVWINHVLGARADLSREIETVLADGGEFTASVNETLFERFFANSRLTVEMVETSESIARELSGVVSSLRDAGALTGTYAETLQDAVTDLERGGNASDLRAMMANLAAATREMAANNRQLSERMELSSRQVEVLQTTLRTVKVEALTDALTGLANRRMFDETLSRRVAEVAGSDAGLCLLMCDIDHFKRFNDSWGHQVGDQVIRFIASVLRERAQGDYLAARYGGEEFAIVLPRVGLDEAHGMAAAMREAIKSKRLSRRSTGEMIGCVTVSIGIAQLRDAETPGDLIGRADACLYASKRAGRDRITTDAETTLVSAA